MADSTSNLAQLTPAQLNPDVTANELFDAHSPASLFGRNADTSAALTWGYYGGKYRKADGSIATIANGTVALTASATNYIKETDGVVSKTTSAPSGWPSPLSGGAKALYEVVCDGSGVTSYTDYRTTGIGSGSGAGTGTVTSIGVSVPAFLSVSGSPVTSSGMIAISYSGVALPVANGGTGATSASAARAALGLVIGTDVQAYNAKLADLAGITYAQGDVFYYSGTNIVKLAAGTSGYFLQTQGSGANPKWAAAVGLGTANVFTKNQSVTPVALTDGASIAVDASLSNNFSVTLGGNRSLANPTNLTAGMVLNFCIDQDATGGRTLTYGNLYKFPGGTATLSTAANAKDFLSCYYDGTVLRCNLTKAYS